jgi:hypothetical protein
MISRFDDSLVHQDALPLSAVASGDPDWEEAIYFNLHSRDGRVSAIASFEALPNAGHVRAFLLTRHDGVHASSFAAGPLGAWREELRVGALSFSVLEPMRAWRLQLSDEANGVHAELDFEARFPACPFPPIRVESEGALVMDQSYFNQGGSYRGVLRIGEHEYRDLVGTRARRWGMLRFAALPFYHWISVQLPGRYVTAWQFESAQGEVLYCGGAVVSESGEITPVVHLAHEWIAMGGPRHPQLSRIVLETEKGEELRLKCREIGSHFLGAGSPSWSETDAEALATAAAGAMSVESVCEIALGDERACGVLDVVGGRGYRRYGVGPLGG